MLIKGKVRGLALSIILEMIINQRFSVKILRNPLFFKGKFLWWKKRDIFLLIMYMALAGLFMGLEGCKKKSGDSTPIPDTTMTNPNGTLTWIQANIFDVVGGKPSCATAACHGGAQNPNLSSKTNSFNNLVGKPSGQNATLNYVEPGDSAKSYLFTKLISAVGGARMPQNNTTYFDIHPDELQNIKDWIDEGALDN